MTITRVKPTKVKAHTEGEYYIDQYLLENGIERERDLELHGLVDDPTKKFRQPDFYLPEFDVYIEYLGMLYVSEEKRKEYDEKKRVYRKNKINTIWINPEHLGILDYVLKRRLNQKLLRKGETTRVRFRLFRDNLNAFGIIIALYALYYALITEPFLDRIGAFGVVFLLLAYTIWLTYQDELILRQHMNREKKKIVDHI